MFDKREPAPHPDSVSFSPLLVRFSAAARRAVLEEVSRPLSEPVWNEVKNVLGEDGDSLLTQPAHKYRARARDVVYYPRSRAPGEIVYGDAFGKQMLAGSVHRWHTPEIRATFLPRFRPEDMFIAAQAHEYVHCIQDSLLSRR